MRNKIGKISKRFGKIEDPSVFGVLYLPKSFGNFTDFISHAKSIYLKNIGHNRGNTKGVPHSEKWRAVMIMPFSQSGRQVSGYWINVAPRCHCIVVTIENRPLLGPRCIATDHAASKGNYTRVPLSVVKAEISWFSSFLCAFIA
jgi:hypothetical protein